MSLQVLKILKNTQQRILYLEKLSFKYGEINTFSNKRKLRELITTKQALQEMLREDRSHKLRALGKRKKKEKKNKRLIH